MEDGDLPNYGKIDSLNASIAMMTPNIGLQPAAAGDHEPPRLKPRVSTDADGRRWFPWGGC